MSRGQSDWAPDLVVRPHEATVSTLRAPTWCSQRRTCALRRLMPRPCGIEWRRQVSGRHKRAAQMGLNRIFPKYSYEKPADHDFPSGSGIEL
jgi:hypothetical protein